MAFNEVDLREFGVVFVLIEELSCILKGVIGLFLMIEAAVSCSRDALSKSKLKFRLMEVGIAIEGEGLMIGYRIHQSVGITFVHISPIGCAKARGKASHESPLIELLVEAGEAG